MRKLLIALPQWPTSAFLDLMAEMVEAGKARDWSITVVGQTVSDLLTPIAYPDGIEVIPLEPERSIKKGQSPFLFLHGGLKDAALQVMKIAPAYDLIFSPCADWLMIDDWKIEKPLVAHLGDFSFEKLPEGNFVRVFFWETSHRLAERAALAIFPDDFAAAYAQRVYGFQRSEVLIEPTAADYFDQFEQALTPCAS